MIDPPWNDDRFRFIRPLGSGNFGVVSLAFDAVRREEVAVKRLHDGRRRALDELRREFRRLKDVTHPNLVTLHELVGSEPPAIVMEYVAGDTLDVREDRSERSLDEGRHLLFQLASGVDALHQHGILHCDLKPSNVVVTQEDRVVLLDAGLAQGLASIDYSAPMLVGTPFFLAPEQLDGLGAGPAVDWYSFGVLVFHWLTGRFPFAGEAMRALHEKLNRKAPAVGELRPDIDPRTQDMVDRLLSREPNARPDAAEILDWLEPKKLARSTPTGPLLPVASPPPFVGRRRELAFLDEEARLAERFGFRLTFVVGVSGIGKSRLVGEWLGRLSSTAAESLVGRCYQREIVPFSGIEEIVGTLVSEQDVDPGAATGLEADEADALERIFGIAVASDGARRESTAEARELAVDSPQLVRLVARAVGRMLRQRAGERRLVLCIDDAQWAGRETGRFILGLAQLEWPAGCHVLVTRRSNADTNEGDCVEALAAHDPAGSLTLGPIDEVAATELLRATLGRRARGSYDTLARNSQGNPLILEQLASYLVEHPEASSLEVDEVLRRRLADLPPPCREVLCLVASVEIAVPEAAVLAAAGYPSATETTRQLLALRLVQRARRSGHYLEPFHDAVRQVVAEVEPADATRERRGRLARALEGHAGFAPDVLVTLFLRAGEEREAARCAARAAEELERALAFRSAAELYQRAIDATAPADPGAALGFRRARAMALLDGGYCEEGARSLISLASEPDVPDRDELLGLAASNLIQAGCVDEGVALARGTLQRLGVRLAPSGLTALPSIAASRLRLSVRGMRSALRDEGAIAPDLLARIDWCLTLGLVLPVIDTLRAFQLHQQGLRWALDAGEPGRLARALAMEAGFRAALGADPKRIETCRELLERARKLARLSESPRAMGVVELVAGSTRWSVADWEGCVRHSLEGIELLRTRCRRASWEINFGQTHLLDAYWWSGRFRDYLPLLDEERHEAEQRGDVYALVMLEVRDGPQRAIILDRAEEAPRYSAALDRWPNRGFQVEHMTDGASQARAALYRGEPQRALEVMETMWAPLVRSQLLRLQAFRCEMHALRANAAISAAEVVPATGRRALLAKAKTSMAALRRDEPSIRSLIFGAAAEAGVANVRGDEGHALAALRRGLELAESNGMGAHAASMAYVLGRLEGGSAGDRRRREAGARLRAEGVVCPAKLARSIVPGFERLLGL